MTQPKAKVVHYTDIRSELFGDEAPGTYIRWLIDKEHDGAPVAALRMVEVKKGGHTPRHTHPYEHENYIIGGVGRVLINSEWHELKAGDIAFVPPDVLHQYENAGDDTFTFLCIVPV